MSPFVATAQSPVFLPGRSVRLLTQGVYWTIFDTLPTTNRQGFKELWGKAFVRYVGWGLGSLLFVMPQLPPRLWNILPRQEIYDLLVLEHNVIEEIEFQVDMRPFKIRRQGGERVGRLDRSCSGPI